MEHIIQLGVSIDDDKIEKALIKSATEKLQQEKSFQGLVGIKGFLPPQSGSSKRLLQIGKMKLSAWPQKSLQTPSSGAKHTKKR